MTDEEQRVVHAVKRVNVKAEAFRKMMAAEQAYSEIAKWEQAVDDQNRETSKDAERVAKKTKEGGDEDGEAKV